MTHKRRPDPFERFFRELDAKMREDETVLPVPIGTFSYLCRMNEAANLPAPDWAMPIKRLERVDEMIG